MQPARTLLHTTMLAFGGLLLAGSASADENTAGEACRSLALEQGFNNVDVRTIEDLGEGRFDVVLRGEEPDDKGNRSDIPCIFDEKTGKASIGEVTADELPADALPATGGDAIEAQALAACTEAVAGAGYEDAVLENRWVRKDGGRTIRYTVKDPKGDDLRCLFAPVTGETTLYFKEDGAPPVDVDAAARAACSAWVDGKGYDLAEIDTVEKNEDGTRIVTFKIKDADIDSIRCSYDPVPAQASAAE